MKKNNNISPEEQRENIKAFSEELARHSPLIKELAQVSKEHERKMFNKEVFFAITVFIITGILAYLDKLSGETLAGLIGVVVGYILANNN